MKIRLERPRHSHHNTLTVVKRKMARFIMLRLFELRSRHEADIAHELPEVQFRRVSCCAGYAKRFMVARILGMQRSEASDERCMSPES